MEERDEARRKRRWRKTMTHEGKERGVEGRYEMRQRGREGWRKENQGEGEKWRNPKKGWMDTGKQREGWRKDRKVKK